MFPNETCFLNEKAERTIVTALERKRIIYELRLQLSLSMTFQNTLDSGIDVAPGINVAPPLKNIHIKILMHFYINQGIAVILNFFFLNFIFKN